MVCLKRIMQMQTVLSGTGAGNFREAGDEYRILVKLNEAEGMGLDELLDLSVVNADGEPVILRNMVHTKTHEGP